MRIFCLGDSIMQYNDCTTYPQTGWIQELSRFFIPGTEFLNYARNGRSSKSFIAEGRFDSLLKAVRPGDYALIQFGHNDEKEADPNRYTSPEIGGEFRRNLEYFTVNLLAHKCFPILLTPMARRKYTDSFGVHDGKADEILLQIHKIQAKGASSAEDAEKLESLRLNLHELWTQAGALRKIEPTHGEYPNAIKEVAERLAVPCIDMTTLSENFLEDLGEEKSRKLYMNFGEGEYINYPEGKNDNSHLRPDGAFEFSRIAAMEIAKLGDMWANYENLSNAIVGKMDDIYDDGEDIDDEFVMFK